MGSCLAVFAVTASAQAVTVSIEGDTGGPKAIGETGWLQVIVDIAPENETFRHNGLSLKFETSQAGVIAFTGAAVDNRNLLGSNIWSLAGVNGLSADAIDEIWSASISSEAFNPDLPGNPIVAGGTEFLFATIDYEVVGGGSTRVLGDEAVRLCPSCFFGSTAHSPSLVFVPSAPIIGVPEPVSLVLIGLGLLGVGFRRRRSLVC